MKIELKQQPAGPATSPVVRAIIIITTGSTAQAADGTDENTKQCGVPGLCIFFSGETRDTGAIGLVQSRIRLDDERRQSSDATVRNFRTLSLGSYELKVE